MMYANLMCWSIAWVSERIPRVRETVLRELRTRVGIEEMIHLNHRHQLPVPVEGATERRRFLFRAAYRFHFRQMAVPYFVNSHFQGEGRVAAACQQFRGVDLNHAEGGLLATTRIP